MRIENARRLSFSIFHSHFQLKIMFKHILQSEGDINWLAIVALVLFFAIFLFSTVWILTRKKDYVDKVSRLPLDD